MLGINNRKQLLHGIQDAETDISNNVKCTIHKREVFVSGCFSPKTADYKELSKVQENVKHHRTRWEIKVYNYLASYAFATFP